jgi:hypothetical protein
MTTKHTDGPWRIYRNHVMGGAPERSVASGASPADARLIAAAPDLFEACEVALAHVNASAFRENVPWARQMLAAIAKARGGK